MRAGFKVGAATIVAIGLVAAGCENTTTEALGPDTEASFEQPALGLGPGAKPMILRLLGTDAVTEGTVADPNDLIPGEEDEAFCYTVPMWDVAQNRVVGTATDCISVLGLVGDGVQVVGTTTFDFGGGHSFTAQGLTSVQPTTHGSPEVTHITGAIPVAGENGIIAGTGRFRNFHATARLSGAVNLAAFPGAATFDCLFVITP